MAAPVGLSATLAALALAVATYAALRLAMAWPWGRRLHYDINLSHVLMGTAMAGMAVPSVDVLPARAWEGVFGAEAVWFVWATARFVHSHGLSGKDDDWAHRSPHYATHMVMAFSMLFMYLAGGATPTGHAAVTMPPSGPGTAGPGGAGSATWLALLFVVALLVSATCEIDSVNHFARLGAFSTTDDDVVRTTSLVLSATGGPAATGRPAAHVARGTGDGGATITAGRWLAPRLEAASHVAMCVLMAYMLVIMW